MALRRFHSSMCYPQDRGASMVRANSSIPFDRKALCTSAWNEFSGNAAEPPTSAR